MKCGTCGETSSPAFIAVGDACICHECAMKHKGGDITKKVESSIPTQTFLQYVCKTHNCGTPKSSQYMKHDMADCEWIMRELPMWHEPKTFGGHNGDISRKFYVQECDIIARLEGEWNRLVVEIRRKYGLKNYQGGGNSGANRRSRSSRNRKENAKRT